MKKPVRLLLLGTVLALGLLLVAGGLALHSGVQTWAARRALAGQTRISATLGELSAGLRTVALRDVHLEHDGAVITLPWFNAELSVIDAGLNQKVTLKRLVAKGWTLDLTRYRFPAAAPVAAPGAVTMPAPVLVPVAVVARIFQGVFAHSTLPFDLVLDGVELEGDVLLPPAPGVTAGRAHVILDGGGLAAGHEGAFKFKTTVTLMGADLHVTSLTVEGRFAAAMDTPRTFTRLTTRADAAASGPQFPGGVRLVADLAATRTPTGGSYSLLLSDPKRLLASLKADLPLASRHLAGTWKLDVCDTDLAPFTLGRALPTFALDGAGAFDVEIATAETRAIGKLDAAVDKLGPLRPELAALGAVRLVTEFDLAWRGENLRVEHLTADFSSAQPVASVQALQPFEFNAGTGELKVADTARDLIGLRLHGLPLAWLQPLLRDYALSGGNVRGEFSAIARNGGFTLRSRAPLALDGVTLSRGGQPLLTGVELALTPSADYSPQGWQVELLPFAVTSGGRPVLTVDAKMGQLTGKAQPIKAAGKFSARLPSVLQQPAASGLLVLTAGEASGHFAVSLGATKEIEVKLALTELATDPKLTGEKLPQLYAEVRSDITATGAITLTAPLQLERGGKKSDLTVSGTLTPQKGGFVVDTHVTSTLLVVDDLQLLALPFAPSVPASEKPAARDAAPPWAGLNGTIALALKKIIYSDLVEVSDVSGTVRLEAGAARLVDMKAGLGEGAEAKLNGNLTFDAKSSAPYGLAADVLVSEFDPAPFFRAVNPTQPASVEGKFNVATKLAGQAASLGAIVQTARGEVQLTSKTGFFRGLPVSYASKVESTGKIAASVAAVSNLLGSMTGRKDYAEIANRAQAVAELTKSFNPIAYDQLNVVLVRDGALHTMLKDFTLISPELRLSGAGVVALRPGVSLLEQSLTMEFKLSARGRQGELLKYLGALEARPDELGYVACTLPLKISGTIGQPDTRELNRGLAQLALEKAGVTEKASGLINRLIGNGK